MDATPSATQDLTTSAGILAALSDTHFACSSVERLSGGFANYTWRGFLLRPLPDGSSSVVIKHAAPFTTLAPQVALDPIRIDYESEIMSHAHETLRIPLLNSGSISIPEVYHHDREKKILVMEDAGSSAMDLKAYLLSGRLRSEDVDVIAEGLADFATALHQWGKSQPRHELRERLKTHTQATTISIFVFYGRLVETIGMFPPGSLEPYRGTFGKVQEKMELEMREGPDRGVIHGDYWPGNIIVTADLKSPLRLRVIDWEVAKIAPPFFDIAQMAAELFLAFHFKDCKEALQILDTFLERYSGLESPDSRYNMAIHFGTHLVVWPVRVPGWGESNQIEECAKIGAEFIKTGFERDDEWLRGGVLKAMFK